MRLSISDMLLRSVWQWCGGQGVTLSGKTVLCAVSGGRDSVALLHLLLRLGQREGFGVAAAHYNHHLRDTAQRDEDLVRRWCGERGVALVVGGGDVLSYAKARGTSVEDAARILRYAFLDDTAQECGADYIATAHHRQDNAETVLLHLLRGSGLAGLGGIPPVRGHIIRPLLDVSRAQIDAYIRENGLPYAEDETNADIAYTRNRLRLELLPLLEEIAPGSVERIADTAARLRQDEAFMQKAALLPEGVCELAVSLLKKQDPPIAVRLVRKAAQNAGGELTFAQTEAALNLKNGASLSLGGGLRAAREGDVLRFYRVSDAPAPMPLRSGEQIWGDFLISVRETEKEIAKNESCVVLCTAVGELTVAAWDGTGRLGVENGRRTVKRLFADQGIRVWQRENCPALYADGKLVAVLGAGAEFALVPKPGEKKIVVQFENKYK